MAAFEEMGMVPEMAKAVIEMDWILPTDIQSEAIPALLGGGDVLMAAETGSGKTGAFCLPVLQIVWETLRDRQMGIVSSRKRPAESTEDGRVLLNVFDRGDALAVDEEKLLCQSRDPQKWHGCRATRGVINRGKYYYECTVTDDGLCRVGWSTLKASLDLGTDRFGFGYGGTGKKSNDRQFDDYGQSFTLDDTIGCFLDLDHGSIHFSKNGQHFPTAFTIPRQLCNEAFFPALVLKNAEIHFNFGATPFKYPPSSGFVAMTDAQSECLVKSSIGPGGSNTAAGASRKILNSPMCLILEPTRELAEQTHAQILHFKKYLPSPILRAVCVVGSVPAGDQLRQIEEGCDIVTGTPGRLQDFVESGRLSLENIRFFVLDEADGLLNSKSGHAHLIENMHKKIPRVSLDGTRLQMIVCSATLHNWDDKLMHFPQWIDLKGQDSVPDTVHHVVCLVDPRVDRHWMRLRPGERVMTDGIHADDEFRPGSEFPETLSEAVKILKGEYVIKTIDQHKMDQGLIFCRTKIDCDHLEQYLKKKSQEYSCVCLHGDRSPEERKKNLDDFKAKKVRFLICTDVAARGIDVRGIPYVINVTLPDEKANYLHRIGRVGRAERMGLAISFVATVPEKVWYHRCDSRGKSCKNTRLDREGGCAIWYNEKNLLAEIEEHLGVTVAQIDTDMVVPVDEFDGKVVYGKQRGKGGSTYEGHAMSLKTTVEELTELERTAQLSYLKLMSESLVR